MTDFDSSMVESFAQTLRDCNKVVLTCHTNADGDALGSTLGMQRVLRSMGKQADVITPDLAPTMYTWIDGFKTLRCYERQQEECDKIIDEADLLIFMDFNDLARTKVMAAKLEGIQTKRVLIDHHLDPMVKADVSFSHPEASSTCQLVYSLLLEAGLKEYVDTQATQNFYAGIVTDTGGLSYNSSDPKLYELIASMLRKGIDKTFVHDKIFNSRTLRQLKLQGFSLGRKLHRVERYPLAVMALSAKELEQYKYTTGDVEGLVNIPLQVKDIMVSCLMLERPDCIKMSFRSKGEFPVNEFSAEYFGGGGHLNAAGGTFHGSLEEATELYCKAIADFYERWMKKTAK